MIFLLMFFEFFKIGLFAIGGGLVTLPFLFELSHKYGWFSQEYLVDAIALSQSVPGPLGVNASAFVGFETTGVLGAIIAAVALVSPAVIVIMSMAGFLKKHKEHPAFKAVLEGIYPAVIVLISMALWEVAKVTIIDWFRFGISVLIFALILIFKKNPIFYVFLSAIIGVVLRL